MAIGTVARGDLVVVGPKAPGLWIVDSVNADDLGIVKVEQASTAPVGSRGYPVTHVSISADVFAVYNQSSTIL